MIGYHSCLGERNLIFHHGLEMFGFQGHKKHIPVNWIPLIRLGDSSSELAFIGCEIAYSIDWPRLLSRQKLPRLVNNSTQS